MDIAAEINTLRYLYLTELAEPEDNVLRLVVTEGRVGEQLTLGKPMDAVDEFIAGSRPIVADDRSAAYEITFESYVAYAVVNESYTIADDTERFDGKLLRTYSESKFLSYVALATIASEDYGGPYRHYGIVCLNHIVEVASRMAPTVVRLRPSGGRRQRGFRFVPFQRR